MRVFKNKKFLAIILIGLAIAGYWGWNYYQNSHYLKIGEWGVTLPLTPAIHGATYHLNGEGNVAFLSTTTLDNSVACQAYYHKQQGASFYYPAYQFITRLAPNDPTIPTDGSLGILAKDAVAKYPDIYRQVGNSIYQYAKGRGVPCPQQPSAVEPAYYTAFKAMH